MKIHTLEQFTESFHALMDKGLERAALIKHGREMLGELIESPDWFQPVLTKLVLDDAFLKAQWQSIDANDLQLYHSKLFSVRAYIWEANVTYPIHDHGAWGIVGDYINQIRERKFIRTDDRQDENLIEIKQVSDNILLPGQTTFVLPVYEGIHQMEAINGRTAVSIHVYGAPIRKGYINYYDPVRKSAQRVYTPSQTKRVLAIKTLGSMPDPWAKDVLDSALRSGVPEYIGQECQAALDRMKG